MHPVRTVAIFLIGLTLAVGAVVGLAPSPPAPPAPPTPRSSPTPGSPNAELATVGPSNAGVTITAVIR